MSFWSLTSWIYYAFPFHIWWKSIYLSKSLCFREIFEIFRNFTECWGLCIFIREHRKGKKISFLFLLLGYYYLLFFAFFLSFFFSLVFIKRNKKSSLDFNSINRIWLGKISTPSSSSNRKQLSHESRWHLPNWSLYVWMHELWWKWTQYSDLFHKIFQQNFALHRWWFEKDLFQRKRSECYCLSFDCRHIDVGSTRGFESYLWITTIRKN